MPLPASRRLAGDGDDDAARGPVALDGKDRHRRDQQHQRIGRTAREVVLTDDSQVRPRGQDLIITAQDQRIGQIRDGFDEQQQERTAESRHQHRSGDGAEYPPPRGSQRGGRFLMRRVQGAQHAQQIQICQRQIRQRQRQDQALQPIDVIADTKKVIADHSGASEERDDRRRHSKGRGDDRHQRQDVDQPLPWKAQPGLCIGQREGTAGAQHPDDQPQLDSIEEKLPVSARGDEGLQHRQPLTAEGTVHHPQDRQTHQQGQRDQHQNKQQPRHRIHAPSYRCSKESTTAWGRDSCFRRHRRRGA